MLVTSCGSGPVQLSSDTKHTTVRAEAVTFSYPAGWSITAWDSRSSFTYMVAAVSNQSLNTPCTHSLNSVSCGPPVDRLDRGAVLIEWWQNAFPTWSFDKQPGDPMVVDGLRAKRQDPAELASVCPAIGADSAMQVLVDRNTANYFAFVACFRGPNIEAEHAQALAILASAHLKR